MLQPLMPPSLFSEHHYDKRYKFKIWKKRYSEQNYSDQNTGRRHLSKSLILMLVGRDFLALAESKISFKRHIWEVRCWIER